MRHYKTDPGDPGERKKNNTDYGQVQLNWLPTLNKRLKSMSTFRITNFKFWPMVGLRIIRSNGWTKTFEWLKVVSEVVFPMFWGVVCKIVFRNWVSVVGGAVSKISRFAHFYKFRDTELGGNLSSSQLSWLWQSISQSKVCRLCGEHNQIFLTFPTTLLPFSFFIIWIM